MEWHFKNIYITNNLFEDIFLSNDKTGTTAGDGSCKTDDHDRGDAFGVLIWSRSSNILIKNNTVKNISGDGVQCAGASGGENDRISKPETDHTYDPSNIEIVDNTFEVHNVIGGIQWRRASENAVDIKSCQKVTIARNRGSGWLGKDASSTYGVGAVKGGAFVAHYNAEKILIEDNAIRNTCGLVGVGKTDAPALPVEKTVIRRNLFVRTQDACEGGNRAAVKLNWVHDIDISNNTLVFPRTPSGADYPSPDIFPGDTFGIEIARGTHGYPSSRIDVWNNIIDHPKAWISYEIDNIVDTNKAIQVRARSNFFQDRTVKTSNDPPPPGKPTPDGLTDRIWPYQSDARGTRKEYHQFDVTSFLGEPGYAEETDYTLDCEGAAARAGFRLFFDKEWKEGNTYETSVHKNRIKSYAVGWKQPNCTPTVPLWRRLCNWKGALYGCLSIPKRFLILRKFEFNAAVTSLATLEGTRWELFGDWFGQNEHVIGATAGGIALFQGSHLLNSETVATVTLTNTNATLSGIVSRAQDDSTYYAFRLSNLESYDIVRMRNGSRTVLAAAPYLVQSNVPYRMQLVVRGTNPVHLEGWLDGTKVLDVSDSSGDRIIAPGRSGLLSGNVNETEFEEPVVYEEPPEEPTENTLVVSDDFSLCADDDPPNASLWTTSGSWYCRSDRLRGESAESLALLSNVDVLNAEVRARVRLTGTATGSGVVARAQDGSYYAARIEQSGSVRLVRVTPEETEELASAPYSINNVDSYRLELKAVGWLPVALQVSIDGDPVLTYIDDSEGRLTTGRFGLLSGDASRTQFDDVYLTARDE